MKFELIHELREQGLEWSEIDVTDTQRKKYYGWLEAKQDEQEYSDLEKQAKTLQAIRKARKELGIERSINNEQIRDLSIHKLLTEEVKDAIKELPQLNFTQSQKAQIKNDRVEPHIEHIIALGDLHYTGDKIELEYLWNVFLDIINVVKQENIKTLHLFEMGDVIEGASLRNSQLMGIKTGMVSQIIQVAEVYAENLAQLSEYVNLKFYSVDSSNHTQLRNLGTKQNELVEEDLMIVFNNYIRTRLPELDITTGVDVITQINGFDVYIAHGHLMGKKEGYIDKVASTRHCNIDYGFFGHYHHKRDIDLHRINYKDRDYDKKAFYVPALKQHTSNFETDKFLSSVPGFAVYEVDEWFGINKSWKVPT